MNAMVMYRSMIEVTKRYSNDSIKCCRLHDPLLRLLAIHEAKEKRFVRKYDSYIMDLFNSISYDALNVVKRNHKFGGKFMDVAQLADASCIFNFGENFPLETPLMSNIVLEIDDTKSNVDVVREVKQRGEFKYLDLSNLRLLSEILEINESDQHLTTLVVRDPNIETLPSNGLLKMISLQHFFLRNTKVREIPKLPESLKTLDVSGTPIETLPEWIGSSKLISLILRNTKVGQIPKLPESLETLDVGGTPIETLPEWIGSSKLISLILRNTKVGQIPKLPESLETLDVGGTPIETLPVPESFTNLMYLDVRNTFVRSLPVSLWSNLRSVLATDTLQHLDGPPTSLKENNRIINFGRRPRNDFTPDYYELETLEIVRVTKDWASSIPRFNVWTMKKLGLSYFQNDFTPDNALDWNIITKILGGLPELSSLKIQGSNIPAEIINVPTCPSYQDKLRFLSVGGSYSLFSLRGIDLPPHLVTLRLDILEFDEDPMPSLGELKKLESLQLRWLLYNAQDKRMICSNGKFPELKWLHLSHISDLEEWSVEEGGLPSITRVIIENCRDLKNLSDSLVRRTKPLQELHLKTMPTGFTNLFSSLPFVKITKNQI